ncbi:class I SAM-dependent methyltransferase [Rhodopila sp.]|uniref:class I SAM-dependent methyltransferase n=1 Tax=Rhodopila sp. TaxID=2480087 RepID=UPI003D13723E
MNATDLETAALQFMTEIDALKTEIDPKFPWYPYGSLNNFVHLKPLFEQFPLHQLLGDRPALDIGAADGDLAFFLERLGHAVEVIDHAPTNFNGLRGARLLAERLNSAVVIHDVDLDSYFALPATRYDLVFFLGILYHLKSPFLVLESLSKVTKYLLLSTRIARFTPQADPIRHLPVAYLLDPTEANNDSTNYWIFSETGLLRLFDRSGWDVLAHRSVGDTKSSDPARPGHDERCFALLASRAPFPG